MSSAASSYVWIRSPEASSCSHLSASTLSFAHWFSVRKARGIAGRRTDRAATCSLNAEPSYSSSPSRLPAPVDSGEIPYTLAIEPVRGGINEGEKGRANFSFVEDERFTPLSRRPRFRLRSQSARRRPLWARIFFASKKVRSIILLNALTVIYGTSWRPTDPGGSV